AQQHQLTLTSGGEPAVVYASSVGPEFFSVFGQAPLAGRTLRGEDAAPGAPAVAVLSERLWRSRFGGDPRVLGSAVRLDQRAFSVVGVMPATFRFPSAAGGEQVWIPVVHDPLFGSWMPRRTGHWLQVTGRLKPGVSADAARAELAAIGSRLAAAFPAEN